MASKRIFLILIPLHFSLLGLCQFEKALQQADSLFGEGQDSLGYLIIQDLRPETEREKLWIAKLWGDYYFGQNNYREAVKSYQKLLVPFDSTNELLTAKIARGINDMGILYFRLSNPDSAILAHRISTQLYEINNDLYGISMNYNNLGIIYDQLQKWDSAMLSYQISLDKAIEHGDTVLIGYKYLNIGVHHFNQSNIIEAAELFAKSVDMFKQAGDLQAVMRANRKLYVVYLHFKDYPTALPILYSVKNYYEENTTNTFVLSRTYNDLVKVHKDHTNQSDSVDFYIEKGLDITNPKVDIIGYHRLQLQKGYQLIIKERFQEALGIFKNVYDDSKDRFAYLRNIAIIDMGKTHLKLQDYKKALETIQPVFSFDTLSVRHEDWYAVYDILHKAHMALGNVQDAQKYFELYLKYEKKIFDREKNLDIARIEYRNQLERERALQKAREEKLQLEIERRQLIILGTVVLLFLAIVLAIVSYRSYQRKKDDNQQLSQKNIELNELRESEKQYAENERELLQETIDTKDRQLASTTMLSLEKNKMIDELDNRLKELEKLDLENVKEEVQQMKKILRAHMSMETSWENFAFQFEQVHPNFFKKLEEQFPETTSNDRKICAYIRIGFGNNEIAQVTNLTLAAVKKSVNRLKKRLGLGAEDNLREFVSKI